MDVTAYDAVTDDLEEDERQAMIRSLHVGAENARLVSAEDEAVALAWVRHFQECRMLMRLVLLNAAEVFVEQGEVGFRLPRETYWPDVVSE